jgi:hypothetical protein
LRVKLNPQQNALIAVGCERGLIDQVSSTVDVWQAQEIALSALASHIRCGGESIAENFYLI